jgi:thymidylate synthase (FAD)
MMGALFDPLDDGISSLELIDQMGGDLSVVNAARVSYGKRSEVVTEKDQKLISYLMRNQHGTPFEHVTFQFRVRAPLFVVHQWERHRMACLPASALIATQQPRGTVYQKPIGKMYEDWKNGIQTHNGSTPYRAKLPGNQHPLLRTLNLETDLVETAHAVDIYEAGVKPVIRVELASGHVLHCTREHLIWTSEGWEQAGNLTEAALVARTGHVVRGEPLGIPSRLREGIQFWAAERKHELIQPVDLCYLCEEKFAYEDLDLDHVVPVAEDLARALDITNLKPACKQCHRGKTNSEQALSRRRRQVLGARYERVVSTAPAGEEMTYDIAMPAPWHNFIADGIVVHNSYNEESGRYIELRPDFYIKKDQWQHLRADSARRAFTQYQQMIAEGCSKEDARTVLPASLYKEFWWTVNARSLMNFIELRADDHAQWEIRRYAEVLEEIFKHFCPNLQKAFFLNGRKAP